MIHNGHWAGCWSAPSEAAGVVRMGVPLSAAFFHCAAVWPCRLTAAEMRDRAVAASAGTARSNTNDARWSSGCKTLVQNAACCAGEH